MRFRCRFFPAPSIKAAKQEIAGEALLDMESGVIVCPPNPASRKHKTESTSPDALQIKKVAIFSCVTVSVNVCFADLDYKFSVSPGTH